MPTQQLDIAYLPKILDAIPVRIFWKDLNCNYLGANQYFLDDANVSSVEELIGKNDFDMAWPREQAEGFRKDDRLVMQTGIPKIDIEEKLTISQSTTIWLNTNKVPLYKDGILIGVLGTYQDITARKLAFKAAEYQAGHDDLTALPNRFYFLKTLTQVLERSNRDRFAGLLFIDLDHFKTVNDSLGHHIGDRLLCQVAIRIKNATKDALVARLGGDEFCVLILNENNKTTKELMAEFVTNIAKRIINALAEPYIDEDNTLYIGASIGMTVITPNDNDASEKMKEADLALHYAKDSGRNLEMLFDESMRSAVKRRHQLENHLRNAINNNELSLAYQPQYNAQKQLIGAEALLRWHNTEFGHISPAEFIPIAEQTGLINSIGHWVLQEAIKKIAQHQKIFSQTGIEHIAINVSAKQFQNISFTQEVAKALAQQNIDPKFLQLEVTETLFMGNEEQILTELNLLKALGITIAMDDFGTGYSSLSYLTRLPIDKLKIDRSFVQNIECNTRSQAIVETVITMTQKLGITSIAEGVETP